jgi:hypothetical protein
MLSLVYCCFEIYVLSYYYVSYNMFHMLIDHMFHITMNMFDIMIYMINCIIYVIIIMLIYRIKMIWKLPNYLTALPATPHLPMLHR